VSGPTGESALSLRAVGKRYGRIRALDGLNLEVPAGSVFGLVGPNGAGKTTTFAIACGFLRADTGTVDLLGAGPFDPEQHRGRITALPQDAALGRDVTVAEMLTYLGLGIGQAFLGDPELVLLDEPTNGLDPRQAHSIREFIASQRGTRTIIVSSHNLHEIETVCDHVALIDRGRVVMAGPVSDVTGRNDEVRITLAEGPVPLAEAKAAVAGEAVEWDEATRVLKISFLDRADRQAEDVTSAVLRAVLAAGGRVSTVTRGESLERKYLELPATPRTGPGP